MKLATTNKKQLKNKLEALYILFGQKEAVKDLGKRALALDGKRLIVALLKSMAKDKAKGLS